MSIDVLTVDYNDPDASKKFENSLKSSGFAIIKNHPIDKDLISKVYDEWVAFFNSKDKFDLLYDENSQDGYFPYLTENAKDSNVKDLKEFHQVI